MGKDEFRRRGIWVSEKFAESSSLTANNIEEESFAWEEDHFRSGSSLGEKTKGLGGGLARKGT